MKIGLIFYRIYTYPWVNLSNGLSGVTEMELTHNNQPCGTNCGGNITNGTNCNTTLFYNLSNTGANTWANINITNVFVSGSNFTFVVLDEEVIGNDVQIHSKERATNHPNITITYARPLNGLIANYSGGEPFWTNDTNPRNITLSDGGYTLVTFWLNVTGDVESTHNIFAYANLSTISNDITNTHTITIQDHIYNVIIDESVGYGYNVTIKATIEDEDTVNSSWVEITFPNSTSINFTMLSIGNDIYQYNLTDTWQFGTHNFIIYYNDSLNNLDSYSDSFNVSVLATDQSTCVVARFNLITTF